MKKLIEKLPRKGLARPEVKLYQDTDNGETWIEVLGQDGRVEDDKIIFITNMAPHEFEGLTSYSEVQKAIKQYRKSLDEFQIMVNILGKNATYEGDFYWSESDLNFIMEIGFNHPLVKSLKLAQYVGYEIDK